MADSVADVEDKEAIVDDEMVDEEDFVNVVDTVSGNWSGLVAAKVSVVGSSQFMAPFG